MRQRKLQRNSGFDFRKSFGNDFELEIKGILSKNGFLVSKLTPENFEDNHLREISLLGSADSTSSFVRMLPDWCCTKPDHFSFFLECKHSKRESKNFSYSLDEFMFHRNLASTFDIKILVAFRDWTGMVLGQWIDQITDYKVYDRSKLDGVNGSKKEFVLIPKSSLPLFNTILYEL